MILTNKLKNFNLFIFISIAFLSRFWFYKNTRKKCPLIHVKSVH